MRSPSAACCHADNLVLDASASKVLAVLDWELSTLGDPMTDVAYNCLVRTLHVICKA